MHRLQSRTYVGQPGESVSVTTTVHGGGQVSVSIGGQPVGAQFQLPGAPGAAVRMDIALAGPQGASCVVGIATVDGGSDPDFLMCTVFNPAPVNQYSFSVAASAAVAAFGAARAAVGRSAGPAPAATARAPRAGRKAKTKTKTRAKSKAKCQVQVQGKVIEEGEVMTRATMAFVLVLHSALAFAQAKPGDVVVDRRPAIVADFVVAARGAHALKVQTPFVVQVGSGNRQRVAAYLMAAHGTDRAAYAVLLKALEAARVDKQIGSPPTANGGTSLAMKGLAPRIFGLAVERGALTREVSGTNVTFRVSPVGAFKALQGTGLVDLNDDYLRDRVQRFAGRFSLAATFDVSRGTSPGVFTGNDQQLASWAARYTFINRRDPAAPEYADRWRDLLSDDTAPYRESVATLNDALGRWAAYASWETELVGAVEKTVEAPFTANQDFEAGVKAFTTVLTDRLKKLESLTMPAEVTSALDSYASQLSLVQASIEKIYAFAGMGPLVTGDWTTTRAVGLPDLFVWTGVFEVGLGRSRKTDFTFNGSVSKYRSMPTGQTHSLKSVELTGQLEHPLGKALPAPTLTFAGRYSYLPNDTVASTGGIAPGTPSATIATAPKGHLGFFQAKLTVPVKDSGMKVPISITASNRTELIKEKDVRGSIGLTLDLDTLMSFVSGLRP